MSAIATASPASAPIALPSLAGIPSLSVQWEQARFSVAARNAEGAARKCREEAVRQAEEAALKREKEATQHAEEAARKIEEEASRNFEEELHQIHLREMETAAAVEAQNQAKEMSKGTARRALENPEKIELAEFPQIIADAKYFDLDPAAISEAERVYRERAVSAFVAQRAEERLRQAAVLGRADKGEPSPEAQFVVRAVPLPLPVVVTTRVISLGKESSRGESQKEDCQEKEREAAFEECDEERSTCVGSDQEASASRIVSAVASNDGDEQVSVSRVVSVAVFEDGDDAPLKEVIVAL